MSEYSKEATEVHRALCSDLLTLQARSWEALCCVGEAIRLVGEVFDHLVPNCGSHYFPFKNLSLLRCPGPQKSMFC